MAAITYAYQAFYDGLATPTQLYQVELADKALAEIDSIHDLTNAVNRRKLRCLAEKLARNHLADGSNTNLDDAIIQTYTADTIDTHAPLLELLEKLCTPPDPY